MIAVVPVPRFDLPAHSCYCSKMDQLSQMMMRIAYWMRHPPAQWQLWTLAIVALAIAILLAIEGAGWWPDALSINRGGIPHR